MKFKLCCVGVHNVKKGEKLIRFVPTLTGWVKSEVEIVESYPHEVVYRIRGVEGELSARKSNFVGIVYRLVGWNKNAPDDEKYVPLSEEAWKIAFYNVEQPYKTMPVGDPERPTLHGYIKDGMICLFQK